MRFASVFDSLILGVLAVLAALAWPEPASAQPSAAPAIEGEPAADVDDVKAPLPAQGSAPSADPFEERLVLDSGRFADPAPAPEATSFSLRGEYQLRYRARNNLRLEAPVSDREATTLGQNQALTHWLRVTSRFHYRGKVAVVAQLDVLRGLIGGDTTRHVDKVRDAYAVASWYEVHPRYLYVQLSSPIGFLRVGQQGAHWGTGVLVNDGDHPRLFGDYRRGALVERVLVAATPLGADGPLTVAVAGDLVFEDNAADLLGDDVAGAGVGDIALQAVASALWRERRAEIGLHGTVRRQHRERRPPVLAPISETSAIGTIDLAGRFDAPVAGAAAHVYGAMEAAVILGATRSTWGSGAGADAAGEVWSRRKQETVRAFGAAATLGAVHVAGRGPKRWGGVVTELEVGYASGDADPHDGVSSRFTFDPNHNVGLVLFDQVLAWKTARAATLAAGDPPGASARELASQGGIFGAAYANPRFVVRPASWLDLKAGVVIAQTTADLVDPHRAAVHGGIVNYDGGDERRHDLGAEIDIGVDARIATSDLATLQLGAEGGVLFPGHAFDDASGGPLSNQYLLTLKLGLHY